MRNVLCCFSVSSDSLKYLYKRKHPIAPSNADIPFGLRSPNVTWLLPVLFFAVNLVSSVPLSQTDD